MITSISGVVFVRQHIELSFHLGQHLWFFMPDNHFYQPV